MPPLAVVVRVMLLPMTRATPVVGAGPVSGGTPKIEPLAAEASRVTSLSVDSMVPTRRSGALEPSVSMMKPLV